MSSRHHTEWLSLIEVSGPFLSVPVLERVFPQGLDAHDPDHVRVLRLAFDEWEDDRDSESPRPAIHREWIRFVLKETLGLPSEVLAEGQDIPQTLKAKILEHGETLRPDVVVRNPEGVPGAGKPRLLVQVYPPEQNLEKPITGRHWKSSPATRMMELLHATDVRLGLVTNGEHWMLVDAPRGETTGFASWYATLWLEEPLTLRAFRSLLGVSRFFSAADADTLERMLKDSASHQQEVTDRLGYQVREAVEEIIRALDRIDQDEKRQLLAGVSEPELYRAALTVMMRLVFLFSAEERDLLLLGDPLYDEHYAVSTLVARLQETADQQGEEILERRHDAWVRPLSTFRAVYGGVQHERMKLLPYAGNLFDPDQFPFLEGRKPGTAWKDTPATPLLIDNRTVLHLLRSLQYLELHGEARRLSFRALDIEQIGHVYEGLLDHTAKRATEPVLSLTAAKGDEPEVALSELEQLQATGEAELLKFLKEQTGRSENTLAKALATPKEGVEAKKLRAACGNDDALFKRVQPFSGLVRNDTFDRPVVIRKGSVYVTAGTDRRSSGTHYTPRSLTEPIVQYTLEPLVYIGPAEGKPKEEWKLRSAKVLLDLKICDMACGSGAFLVQADRYLSERLVEAWEDAEKQHPSVPGITPEGAASTGAANEQLIPKDTDERVSYARRIVAQRCLYGVDKNPLAAEMAKLSLWLLTLAKYKPFTFLDHAIRCGDSLVGVSSETQLKTFSLDGQGIGITLPNFLGMIPKILDATRLLRNRLEKIADDTVGNIEEKQRLFDNIRFQTKRLNYAADRLLAANWQPAKPTERVGLLREALQEVDDRIRDVNPEKLENEGRAHREDVECPQPLHWPLEFPEVFLERGGFDAFVCNPPFLGGKRLTTVLREDYMKYIKTGISSQKGAADLCAYFFLRGGGLLHADGSLGFIATNSIAEGDTREIGLAAMVHNDFFIYRASKDMPWPGVAGVSISPVHLYKGKWLGLSTLNEKVAASISPYLNEEESHADPIKLASNQGIASIGTYVNGAGFVVDENVYRAFVSARGMNTEVLQNYLSGEDINQMVGARPSRYAINFGDRPELEAKKFIEPYQHLVETVKPYRDSLTRQIHEHCFWKHWDRREEFYSKLVDLKRGLVATRVSKHHAFTFCVTGWLISDAVVIFLYDDHFHYAVLQSGVHELWCARHRTSLETRSRYSVSDCFLPFPLPLRIRNQACSDVDSVGKGYYELRCNIGQVRQLGLTDIYNRFHDTDESAADIKKLRDLHVEMDTAVAAAYGWSDLNLGHGFHQTKQGTRFTISESARREVLARLLKLNHERYAEEVAQGLHEKRKGGKGRGKMKAANEADFPSLFS